MKDIAPVYLDCNATTPVEPTVLSVINEYLSNEYGNAGSRTHDRGQRAKKAVQLARQQVADVVSAELDEVIFTSGATESNNLSILGLADYGREQGRMHIISTQIEHKAVLEPLKQLAKQGFEVTVLPVGEDGAVDPNSVVEALRSDTLLVSVMHVNNETGIIQPVERVAEVLAGHDAFFHVDAAQSFGKLISILQNQRIDLISASAHKIYGPKGVGALIMRRRDYDLPPLTPLVFGGGQERGLRPGTLPVPLIAGLGIAAELCQKNHSKRDEANRSFRTKLFQALEGFDYQINGDVSRSVPHAVSLSLAGINSEALMLALKGVVAVSNGSACTSQSYEPSHVLKAMGLSKDRIQSAIRLSWCHMTEEPDWGVIRQSIQSLR